MSMGKDTIEISDLGLAAALVCRSIRLLGTRQDGDGRVHFIFMRTHFTDEEITSYWDDRLIVKAREYFNATKMLKSRIYSEK
jgi:Domain of unknown function (DUF5659)